MKKHTSMVLLQNKTRFSQCKLWDFQREVFNKAGIDAWNNKVPFYITSNPYIADAYANILLRFMQDCSRKVDYNRLEPFYIVELGAGSGNFSFYVIKQLLELQRSSAVPAIKWVYVMTDFTLNNIDYWRRHPALQPYIKQGILDFAVYDLEKDNQLKLMNSGRVLKKSHKSVANPLIVIANYVFDTVSHDVFQVTEGKLQEGLVTLSTQPANIVDGLPRQLNNIQAEFSFRNTKSAYYNQADFDAVLAYYRNHYNGIRFLFPIGSLRTIQQLREISQNRLLLLVTDKGYTDNFYLFSEQEPDIASHTSFSVRVNFHAIGQYFKQCDGDYYYQSTQQAITSAAFLLGDCFNNLVETRQSIKTYFDSFGPGNLFSFYSHIKETRSACSLETLVAKLAAAHWDPELFNACLDVILTQLPHAEAGTIKDLIAGLPSIAANIYYLPGRSDTCFNIGCLLQLAGHYADAITYYQQSFFYYKNAVTLHNMGICYFQLQNYEQAACKLEEALELNPESVATHGWLAHVNDQLGKTAKAA